MARQSAVRTPAPSARAAAAWMTGPSATGSLNGNAKLDHVGAALDQRIELGRAGFEAGIAEHQKRPERALARSVQRSNIAA